MKALVNGSSGGYVVVSDLWDNGRAETAMDAEPQPSARRRHRRPDHSLNSAIGTPGALLGKIRSASDRVTTDKTIVVATAQIAFCCSAPMCPTASARPDACRHQHHECLGDREQAGDLLDSVSHRQPWYPTVVCTPPSGTFFPIGVTTVTCTATDGAGLTDVDTFTVTVNDVDPPVLADHDDVSVIVSPGVTTQAVNFSLPAATDNDHVHSVVCDRAPGSLFPIGVTTVTCTATDNSGLTDTGTFKVTLTTDTQPPVLGSHDNISVAAPAGASGATVTFLPPTATYRRAFKASSAVLHRGVCSRSASRR